MNGTDWKIIDMIKKGVITFRKGDVVRVFRRKSNGHPKGLDDQEYIITNIQNESVYLSKNSSDGIGFLQPIKVHKTYIIPKSIIRDNKINIILGETNLLNII